MESGLKCVNLRFSGSKHTVIILCVIHMPGALSIIYPSFIHQLSIIYPSFIPGTHDPPLAPRSLWSTTRHLREAEPPPPGRPPQQQCPRPPGHPPQLPPHPRSSSSSVKRAACRHPLLPLPRLLHLPGSPRPLSSSLQIRRPSSGRCGSE